MNTEDEDTLRLYCFNAWKVTNLSLLACTAHLPLSYFQVGAWKCLFTQLLGIKQFLSHPHFLFFPLQSNETQTLAVCLPFSPLLQYFASSIFSAVCDKTKPGGGRETFYTVLLLKFSVAESQSKYLSLSRNHGSSSTHKLLIALFFLINPYWKNKKTPLL